MKFDTLAVHRGYRALRDGKGPDVVQPIHLTSTYMREKVESPTGPFGWLSVGIEDIEDLIADLESTFERVKKTS